MLVYVVYNACNYKLGFKIMFCSFNKPVGNRDIIYDELLITHQRIRHR